MTDASPRRVLVTGATGFLGPYVLSELAANGWKVRAALHQPLLVPATDFQTVVVGSIDAKTDWREALDGIDSVVHLAGKAHRFPKSQHLARQLYFDVNTAGTLNLAEAAAAAGIRHFIFVSSISVNGTTTDGRPPFREDQASSICTIYSETKVAAEIGLADIANRTGMPITVVRPPMIYGRHAKGSFRTLKRAIAAQIPLPFGAIQNRRAFVAAENVASFIAFQLSHPAFGFEVFVVADEEQVSTAEFSRRIASALKKNIVMLPIPRSALVFGLHAIGASHLIDSMLGSLIVDTTKALNTGWRPIVTLDEGLARAVEPT